MEKDLVFFGEGGITLTKANEVANFAKLSYTDDETSLSYMTFVDEKIETIDGEKTKDLSYGISDLSDVEQKLEKIGNLKALCAWLREAIAAQQRLVKEANNYTITQYAKDNSIELPNVPVREDTLTEDEVVADFDIKKRNRYYYLETHAATIGQFVHKGGAIDLARKVYYDKLQNPRRTSGSGLDTLIYTYSPSISKEKIEDTFYALQQKHSAYQSELNQLKSEIKSRVTNDDIEKNKKYEQECKEYKDATKEVFNAYSTWKANELKRISSLKIIIPNALLDIYNKVVSTGKKK